MKLNKFGRPIPQKSGQSKAVSFTGYLVNGVAGPQTATQDDVNRMIQEYQTLSKQMTQSVVDRMNEILKNDPKSANVLTPFFNRVVQDITFYENERVSMLYAVANDPRVLRFIRKTEDGAYALGSDMIGDNCYEYATKNVFECVLCRQPIQHTTRYSGVTISFITANYNTTFLQPGFSRGWPIFQTDITAWAKEYAPQFTPDHLKAAVMGDAASCGISCEEVRFNRATYRLTPGKTLIYGIIGKYSDAGGAAYDHHWYQYNPDVGLWTHKRGVRPVTCFDDKGALIFDPRECATGYDLGATGIGFFEIGVP